MTTITAALRSSVGKKYLMGVSGLIWFLFAVGHLIGNFLLFAGRDAFNTYAHFLVNFGHGKAVYGIEAVLVLVLVTHIYSGITVALVDKSNARPQGYEVQGNAGGGSRKTLASETMILTGFLVLIFLAIHITTFKYGPKLAWIPPGSTEKWDDLYGLVVARFGQPLYTLFYLVTMTLFGFHLSHGLWSALQSLGLLNRRTYSVAVRTGSVVAVLLALGFLVLPATVYLMNAKFATPEGGLL